MATQQSSAIARLVDHHGGPYILSRKLDGRPVYQEIQRWLGRNWASPAHIFRLEPLLPAGITVRDLYDDRERFGGKRAAPATPPAQPAEAQG